MPEPFDESPPSSLIAIKEKCSPTSLDSSSSSSSSSSTESAYCSGNGSIVLFGHQQDSSVDSSTNASSKGLTRFDMILLQAWQNRSRASYNLDNNNLLESSSASSILSSTLSNKPPNSGGAEEKVLLGGSHQHNHKKKVHGILKHSSSIGSASQSSVYDDQRQGNGGDLSPETNE
jgi:hypothetical protein